MNINGLQRSTITTLVVAIILASMFAGCTSLKRFAYQGYKRDRWQQPEKVVSSLHLKPGDQVADLGAGGGYFTFRLADAVGDNGKVYAVDIDPGLLNYVEKTAREEGYENIKIIRASEEDAKLPLNSTDLIFVCDTYHHLQSRVKYFEKLKKSLKEGGRIVIIDFTSGWLKFIGHGTPTDVVMDEMHSAGYALQKQYNFLEKQNFLVFQVAH